MSVEVDYYADFGTGEPFLAWVMVELPRMVDTVPAFGPTRDAFHAHLNNLASELGKAFAGLQRLREVAAQPSPVPAIDVEKAYEDFYGQLWLAYKSSFQSAMKSLGLPIGCLFEKETKFEDGAEALMAQQPNLAALVGRMRVGRAAFQTDLRDYRVAVEHKGGPTAQMLARFHQLAYAESTFQNVWRAMQEYATLFVEASLLPGLCVTEIPEAERDPVAPVRFQIGPRSTAAS
jgi:hypothetical protein